MKKIYTQFFILVISAILVSCTGSGIGYVQEKSWEYKNDISKTNELKSFLDTNKLPKIVLRVPSVPSNVTQEEVSKLNTYNTCYNEIEKQLMKSGFTVRDRGLLENLLKTGNSNYQEIGKKIDTDIILEIISLNYYVPNVKHTFHDKEDKSQHDIIDPNYIDAAGAKMEGKIILVDRGQLGGMFTLYLGGGRYEFNYKGGKRSTSLSFVGNDKWYSSLTFTYDFSDDSRANAAKYFANQIIKLLTD